MARNEYDDLYDDDDLDYQEETDGIKSLRRAERAAKKRASELEKELAALKSQLRSRTVKEAVEAKGLNPKIAALVPRDIDPTDSEALDAWLDEYGDLFAPQKPEQSAGEQADGQGQQGTPEVDPNVTAARAISEFQAGGQPVDGRDLNQIMAAIKSAQTPDDLNKLLFGPGHAGPIAY